MQALAADFPTTATMDDLVAAYRILLRRPPDEIGLDHYRVQIEHGMSLERLTTIFLECHEFKRGRQSNVTAVDLGGYSVCVDAKDTDFGQAIVLHRDYEPHVRAAVRELFRPGQTFVDIGANVGCISFLAATIAGPSGQVFAFEPNPTNLQRLYAGVMLNRFTNVKVLPYAASDQRTTFSLHGGTSNSSVKAPGAHDSSSVFTQSVVLDEELAHVPAIDFIKIDIEGHESHALVGCAKLIRRHDPILLTEFSPFWLNEYSPTGARDFAYHVFAHYRRVRAITIWGDSAEFDDPESVLAYWHKRDAELTVSGAEIAGMLHFDLIATNR
jgi:FkbM family methyltransferase